MKATGIVRKIDDLGRVVIPRELMRVYGIGHGDPLEIYTDGDNIILKKYTPACVFCGEVSEKVHKNKQICSKCIKDINKL